MKISEAMRYPHPVLSEYSSDYASGEFRCEFEQNLTSGNELRLAANLEIDSPIFHELIEARQAALGYFVICRRTYYNSLQEVPPGKSEKFIGAQKLFGRVEIRPVIWTLSDLEEFRSSLFSGEFGESVTVGKGAIIAIGPEFQFSVDRKKYKPFDSIFQLAKNDSVEPGIFEVDPDRERITISAEPGTYSSITDMRNIQLGRHVLLNSVYMPAIMDVIARLQARETGLESRKWYRIFRAKCDDLAIDPTDPSQPPLRIAQKLLRQPLRKMIDILEKQQ